MTFSPLVYQTTFRFYRTGCGVSIGIFMTLVVLPLAAAYASRVRQARNLLTIARRKQ